MEQTPLFQLNLMIWLAWPSAPRGILKPVFHEDGFVLSAIGPVFELPLDARARAGAGALPFKERTGPDLLLRQHPRHLLLPIECKLSSFGPSVPHDSDKHQAHQATALLSFSGTFLADYFGLSTPEKWQACLLYTVSGGQEAAMLQTLQELRGQLQAVQIDPTSACALGIHIRDDGVYLSPAASENVPVAALQASTCNGIQVMRLEGGEDPRFLYLIPWDPSIGPADDYERRVLEERVRSALTSVIGSRLDSPSFEVALDEIVCEAVEVWEVWRDRQAKAGFRNAVRAYVKQVLAQLHRMQIEISIRQDTFTFVQLTPGAAHKVRRYLSSAAFRKGDVDLWSEAVQLDFSSLAEGW